MTEVVDTTKCRLPTYIKPTHYNLAFVPDLEANTFQGHELIHITVIENTKLITLNAQEITITETLNNKPHVFVHDKNNGKIACHSITADAKEHRLTFEFEKEITAGDYQLEILFTGILNDQLCGFYRSSYPKPAELRSSASITSGEKVESSISAEVSKIAVTQFEATDARRAFPCWDEPALKATFSLALIVAAQYRALSNMPILSCATTSECSGNEQSRWLKYPAGYNHYVFDNSPLMSTYLLAFVVGEFDYISAFTENQVEMRVYTPVGKSHLGNFALDVAVKCLAYYEKLFGIRNPLPKMDLIAIPDFAAGAMENWGLITYREILLLIDPKTSGQDIKTRVALTVCHELAHSYFGNYTTMEWWSFLWLNESFAHWIEHAACNHIFPEWNIWDTFVCVVHARALSLDAMASSHPIEIPVAHPDTIGEIFDMISYAKGASVLRMLVNTLSFDTFIKGIQLYFKKHAFGNTTSEDLWVALQQASNVDVKKLMHSWVSQMGYPLITVSEESNQSSTRVIKLTQKQYFADMTQSTTETKRTWIVPISVSSYKNGKLIETVQSFLDSEEGTLTLSNPSSKDAALKFNHDQAGFYRVEYSPSLMNALKLEIPILPTTDRLGILRDVFAVASAGIIDVTVALELLAASYSHETNFDVLNSASSDLTALLSLHHDKSYYPALQNYLRRVFEYNYQQLGWEKKGDEDPRTGSLRALVISMLGAADNEVVINEAIKRFDLFIKNENANPIVGDLRRSIYNIALKSGGLVARDALIKLYLNTSSQEERFRVLTSLGNIDGKHKDDAEVARLNIEWGFSESVRSSDVPYLLASIASTEIGRSQIWKYFNENWDLILSRYNAGQNMLLQAILNGSLSAFQREEDATSIEKFFEDHPLPAVKLTIRQIIERIRNKAARTKREEPILQQWLAANNY